MRVTKLRVFCEALVLVVVAEGGVVLAAPAGQSGPRQAECSVRIISVKVGARAIHKVLKTNRTPLEVTIGVVGEPPLGATVDVEVGSYSAAPPGNNLVYTPTNKVVPLRRGRTTVTFCVGGGAKTVNGSVVIAPSLARPNEPGIRIIPTGQPDPESLLKIATMAP